ncbi:Protein of unknown function DUF4505 [Trinorchestia longiramus]|nr:Protein of unknown function DUF4505 [Trinorchestia longiramus]
MMYGLEFNFCTANDLQYFGNNCLLLIFFGSYLPLLRYTYVLNGEIVEAVTNKGCSATVRALGRLVSESACERKDPCSNPAADMVDAARKTAWDLGKQPNNYRSNYPTQEWTRSRKGSHAPWSRSALTQPLGLGAELPPAWSTGERTRLRCGKTRVRGPLLLWSNNSSNITSDRRKMLLMKQIVDRTLASSPCLLFANRVILRPRIRNVIHTSSSKQVGNAHTTRTSVITRTYGNSALISPCISPTRNHLSVNFRGCSTSNSPAKDVEYEQGQSPGPKQREYFYYIDHQGMLFLDDARMKNFTSCFKEKKFLEFFFRRLRVNASARYPQFPFLSLCGVEKNYIRCDDLPIVFTHLIFDENDPEADCLLRYNYGSDNMTAAFQPQQIIMEPSTGRVYHPAPPLMEKHCPVALVHTKLALQLASKFRFEHGEDAPPSHIHWQHEDVPLTHQLLEKLDKMAPLRRYSLGF